MKHPAAGDRCEFDVRATDLERLGLVVKALALRASHSEGDYEAFFRDRQYAAELWKKDVEAGTPLTSERREGLAEFECAASPELSAHPYRMRMRNEAGRPEWVSVRALRAKDGYAVAAIRPSDPSPYLRLSNEAWRTREEAANALAQGLWTSNSNKTRRGR
jgi:hypothetical protein